jgi:outer membrane lipoprotein SlyB
MKTFILGLSMVAALSITAAPAAEAKGCVKGAIVGGIAGHLVHHGVLGAIAGCVVGRHIAHERDRHHRHDHD